MCLPEGCGCVCVYLRVVVTGGPGSGKADQCKFLVDKYKGWVHLSMGGLLRAERKKHGSPNKGWNQIGSLMDSGDMVPEVGQLTQVLLSVSFPLLHF